MNPNDQRLYRAAKKLAAENPELAVHLNPVLQRYAGENRSAAGETYSKMYTEFRQKFLTEVLEEAAKLLKDEGFRKPTIMGPNRIVAMPPKGTGLLELRLQWSGEYRMDGTISLPDAKRKITGLVVTSVSASQVAAESLYKHFQGLIE